LLLGALAWIACFMPDPVRAYEPEEDPEDAARIDELRRRVAELEKEWEQARIEAAESDRKELIRLARERIPKPAPWTAANAPDGETAARRGMAWLAATQRVDGRWTGSVSGSALAGCAVSEPPAELYGVMVAKERMRIVFGHDPAALLAGRRTIGIREQAMTLHAQCELPLRVRIAEADSWLRFLWTHLRSTAEAAGAWDESRKRPPPPDTVNSWILAALGSASRADVARTSPTISRPLPEPPDENAVVERLLWLRAFGTDAHEGELVRLSRTLAEMAQQPGRTVEQWYLGSVALREGRIATSATWARALTEALRTSQDPDGSWRRDVEETAMAVLGLRDAEKVLRLSRPPGRRRAEHSERPR